MNSDASEGQPAEREKLIPLNTAFALAGRLTTRISCVLTSLRNTLAQRPRLNAILGRYSAHLAIVTLALAVGVVKNLQPLATLALEPPEARVAPAGMTSEQTPLPTANSNEVGYESPRAVSGQLASGITRQAKPDTTVPKRPRLDVITYVVQEGDTVFGIAEQFELSPYTIVWSNMEVLQGAPWLLQPGLPLQIPPVDAVYHTVQAGETPADIAQTYEVDTSALYNTWNTVEPGQLLAEGTMLLIPGGIGPDFDWEPPLPPTPVPSLSTGAARPPSEPVSPPANAIANGYFILPTGSYEVSGYTFHGPRNPTHIGLDYRCHLNDPIYAADGGTVITAGWNGGYGNLVRVDHGNGFITYYGHFNSYAVALGQAVAQGQLLGYCGTTGNSTGPHLHFEIRYNGVPQDPVVYQP